MSFDSFKSIVEVLREYKTTTSNARFTRKLLFEIQSLESDA
jgi:hypothetical protein